MGSTQNNMPRLRDNLKAGDQVSAREWNSLARMINGLQAHGGVWIRASVNGLHIGGGGGGGPGFPWSKLAFGYALATKEGETEEDDDTPVVNINAGSVRMHGLRVYTYTPPEDGSELPLVGDDCIVFIEIDRVSSENDITLSAQTVMTPTTATTLRIPLYTFRKTGGAYALHVIHNMGDINIDQPIR